MHSFRSSFANIACNLPPPTASSVPHRCLASPYLLSLFSPQPLVQVPRLWVPAAQCPNCAYPNDASFLFCQRCGYRRQQRETAPEKVSINLDEIDARLDLLQKQRAGKPYERQKSSLQLDLERFLNSMPHSKSVLEATPKDILRFLAWKDQSGKTKVHVPSCRMFGSKSKDSCACPTRLAAGTVDNIIGKLRSLFTDIGRGGDWNELLGVGNPASHKSVKQYLKLVQEEQAIARVFPTQAIPLFYNKICKLCEFLHEQTFKPSCPASQRFLFARDLAFFSLDFFSGDRASDLGRVFTKEVMISPDRSTLLFNHTFGKTLRGKGSSNTFRVKKCQNRTVCPVENFHLYTKLCDLMGIDLRRGYLFRSLDRKGRVSESPFTGSAVANRLSLHLKTLGIHEGETMHSFRSGCSITLSLMGVSAEDVARHVGWKSTITSEYYSQCKKVMDSERAATALAAATATGDDSNPLASSLSEAYQSHNELRSWSLAFS